MNENDVRLPLNAIRVFTAIAREMSVTRAAALLGITQSAASRHLAALEQHLGHRLVERRGRRIELSDFGRLYFEAVAEALDTIAFTTRRMRQQGGIANRLVVRTSLPTFAYSTLIPQMPQFTAAHDGAQVDLVTTLAAPTGQDRFDVLVTRDLAPPDSADQWLLLDEQLVAVGSPSIVHTEAVEELVSRTPVLSVTSRPDILPRWAGALGLALSDLKQGPRYDHHFLAIPAAATGQGLLVTPDILVADLMRAGVLAGVPRSRVKSGMVYSAFAAERSENLALARAFCQWLARLCREKQPLAP
jgi:LysR family glycine cleavage system transcriptional activator